MGIKTRLQRIAARFKLDSHHAIERFGVFAGTFALVGLVVVAGSGVSAYSSGGDAISRTALYTTQFTTSKTGLNGQVDGVYTNRGHDRALVVMHFPTTASISYDASDYRAFLLGSDSHLHSQKVKTPGIQGSFTVLGSTGYVAVLLSTDGRPFSKQVLNLTVRADKELTYKDDPSGSSDPQEQAADSTFSKYDQWRVFFNPGATGIKEISALDAARFDPAQAYYDVVVRAQESDLRNQLDQKLLEMRADLARIQSYTAALATTKVDGLFLRAPVVPAEIAGDKVSGSSATESADGVSTLDLQAAQTVPGGFNFDWQSGNVYDGYLDKLVPPGHSYVQYLADKSSEGADTSSQQISSMQWTLSDGTDLRNNYQASDVTMRPLTDLMNNLSQAYQDYAQAKSAYESELLLSLLGLDVKLRDVQSNGSVRDDTSFLTTLY